MARRAAALQELFEELQHLYELDELNLNSVHTTNEDITAFHNNEVVRIIRIAWQLIFGYTAPRIINERELNELEVAIIINDLRLDRYIAEFVMDALRAWREEAWRIEDEQEDEGFYEM